LLLYYITDRSQFPGDEPSRRRRLLDKIAEAASCSVDYIQLREKDLPARELEILAEQARDRIRSAKSRTALLINSRIDVAIAVGASGVHLRSNDISPGEVGEVYKKLGAGLCGPGLCGADTPVREQPASPVIAVSCHTVAEVAQATASRGTFAVFGPVFGKSDTPPTGLAALRDACRHGIPVLALGGITLENADSCLQAGATGVAAIRLFQENKISEIVRELH
jgi:thiamine-phosphate pyrophosphorylase